MLLKYNIFQKLTIYNTTHTTCCAADFSARKSDFGTLVKANLSGVDRSSTDNARNWPSFAD
jgi:hypothetical protein